MIILLIQASSGLINASEYQVDNLHDEHVEKVVISSGMFHNAQIDDHEDWI